MKTIFITSIVCGLLAYFVTSVYCKTWDVMQYDSASAYFFGTFVVTGFIGGCLVSVLGLDKHIKDENN